MNWQRHFTAYQIMASLSCFIFQISSNSGDQSHNIDLISTRQRTQPCIQSPVFLHSSLVWNNMEQDRSFVFNITEGCSLTQRIQLSRCRDKGQGNQEYLTLVANSLFSFIPLNLAPKLFHSFYLERSPNLEKNSSHGFILDDNSM